VGDAAGLREAGGAGGVDVDEVRVLRGLRGREGGVRGVETFVAEDEGGRVDVAERFGEALVGEDASTLCGVDRVAEGATAEVGVDERGRRAGAGDAEEGGEVAR